jgi:hypothetical protein
MSQQTPFGALVKEVYKKRVQAGNGPIQAAIIFIEKHLTVLPRNEELLAFDKSLYEVREVVSPFAGAFCHRRGFLRWMLVVGLLRDAIEAALGILLFVLFHRAPEAVGIFVRAVAEDVIKEIKTHNWNLLIINEMQSSIDLVRTYSLNQHSDYNCPHEGNPKGVFRNFRKFKSLVFGKIILTVDKNKGKCTESASKRTENDG